MTDEEKRIAIAEACGWEEVELRTFHPGVGSYLEGEGPPMGFDPNENEGFYTEVPDFLNDLNAMHEAEKALEAAEDYRGHLSTIYARETGRWDLERATAAQRAEAFGRTLNLWEDE